MRFFVDVDLDYLPDLTNDELVRILQEGPGEKYEMVKPRFQVPDVIVKRTDIDGAAIRLLQQRRHHRTRLRVYPIVPSMSKRRTTPVGFLSQQRDSQPLADEVVTFLRGCRALHPGAEDAGGP